MGHGRKSRAKLPPTDRVVNTRYRVVKNSKRRPEFGPRGGRGTVTRRKLRDLPLCYRFLDESRISFLFFFFFKKE